MFYCISVVNVFLFVSSDFSTAADNKDSFFSCVLSYGSYLGKLFTNAKRFNSIYILNQCVVVKVRSL